MNEHPDFEELSAYVDGEAPQWLDHVDSCPACRADVDRLRAVAAVVGRPVPPVAVVARERALSLALDAFGPAAAAAGSGADAAVSDAAVSGAEIPLSVRPLRPPAAEVRPPVVVAPPIPRWGRKGPWVALGSVAAVLMAFVLGAAALRGPGGDGGGDDTRTLASGSPDAAERATAPPGGYGLDQSASTGAGGVTGFDLGPVDDAARLATKVGGVLGRQAGSSKDAASAPAPTAAAASPRSPTQDSGLAETAVGTRPCEEQVRASRPQLGKPPLGQVVYFATATSQGRLAFVLGFATGPDPSPVTLLAVAQEGCGLLVEAALP